jgi:hypothetical protein
MDKWIIGNKGKDGDQSESPIIIRTYALQNEKSLRGGFIQTLGNKRKISKKTRPYDGLGSDCVSPNNFGS